MSFSREPALMTRTRCVRHASSALLLSNIASYRGEKDDSELGKYLDIYKPQCWWWLILSIQNDAKNLKND